MKYDPPLQRAILIKRYKRFLADVELPSGEITTIHCPNTGSMKNCAEPGSEVWFSTSDNAKRKYPFTWELGRTSRGHYIGINTHKANQLIKGAIVDDIIPELSGYNGIRTEVKYGNENSRIDILLETPGRENCYVEVKSVTLLESPISRGRGYFPDAVSERGRKHLRELSEMKRQGYRAVLMFCVQHSGIQEVHPARHIDEAYADALVEAIQSGVEVLAYKCKMSSRDNKVVKSLPVKVMDGCE